VRGGSRTDGERSAIRRDLGRGLLLRLAHGAYVERAGFEALSPEDQHVVRMRAITALSDRPVVFSHWSAAVVHGLPVLRSRIGSVHTTVPTAGSRSRTAVTGHVFPLRDQQVVAVHGLLLTGPERTVVDLAGAGSFEEGVMAADGLLLLGVPRAALELAADLAGPRRSASRMRDVVAFAHPGAESAAESRFRVTAVRLGLEPPALQHPVALADGSTAFVDALLERHGVGVGVEVDGDRKYLDPSMAPAGAARAVLDEKRREDEVRLHLEGLVRVGWVQAGSTALLQGLLARVGVTPPRPRATRADYAAAAASARPRFRARRRR